MYKKALAITKNIIYNKSISKKGKKMPIIKVTDDNEWYTPKYLVDYFGKFDYDPASNDYWAKVLQIPNYDTKETDGLKTDWTKYKRIWINPPYTQKKEFLAKAVETYNKAKNDIFILLPVNFIVTKIFANTFRGGEIYIPDTRVKFTSGNGKKASQSPSFGHVVIKIEDGNNKYHLIKIGDLENGNANTETSKRSCKTLKIKRSKL